MMYSSTDLLNWVNLGKLAPSITGLWRPKYAKPNDEYWVCIEDPPHSMSLPCSLVLKKRKLDLRPI
jgi:hypothetical protein